MILLYYAAYTLFTINLIIFFSKLNVSNVSLLSFQIVHPVNGVGIPMTTNFVARLVLMVMVSIDF